MRSPAILVAEGKEKLHENGRTKARMPYLLVELSWILS